MKKEDSENNQTIAGDLGAELNCQREPLFKIGEFYRVLGSQALAMAANNQNDVLFNTGSEFVWAINVKMDNEDNHVTYEKAYYFEEYAIVPAVEELKKYQDHPWVICDCFAYAIDEVNHCAVLTGSNFSDEIAPIDQLETILSAVEYQDQLSGDSGSRLGILSE